MDNTIGLSTMYEIINKETGNIYPVDKYEAGQETVVVHMLDGTAVLFTNKDSVGNLFNEVYAIREIGTHSQPDGTGTVNDLGVSTE